MAEAYFEYVSRLYGRDIDDEAICRSLVMKQKKKHSLLVELLRQIHQEGDVVISPGSGFGHEQGFFPEFNWIGLEHQSRLVADANATRVKFGHSGRIQQWDIYQNPLPKGDILYLCHFCGGGTDHSLSQAADQGYRGVVAMTCCSHRMMDLSTKVHSSRCTEAEWRRLAKVSSKRGSAKGIEAQLSIDSLRVELLQEQGFDASHGWFLDDHGKPLPAGGFIIASR